MPPAGGARASATGAATARAPARAAAGRGPEPPLSAERPSCCCSSLHGLAFAGALMSCFWFRSAISNLSVTSPLSRPCDWLWRFCGRSNLTVQLEAPQRLVVLAREDVDLRLLDRVLDLLLVELESLSAAVAFCCWVSPSWSERLSRSFTSSSRAPTLTPADTWIVSAPRDLLDALVLGVGEPLLGIDAERGEVELVLVAVLLLLRGEALLVLLEDLVGDGVVLALVADVALLAGGDRAGGEVLARSAYARSRSSAGNSVSTAALERALDLQLTGSLSCWPAAPDHPASRSTSRIELAAVDLLLAVEGLVHDLLGVLGAGARARRRPSRPPRAARARSAQERG